MRSQLIITSIVLFFVLGLMPLNFVSAENPTPRDVETLTKLVQQLQEQIKVLRAQIEALQSQLKETKTEAQETKAEVKQVKEEVKEVKEELRLTKTLRFGVQGEDVQKLQELLKQDPEIYPEGLVTGYFGSFTQAAVKRFQEKHADEILKPFGVTEGTGFVGERTLTKLNEIAKATTAVSAQPAIPGERPAIPAASAAPPEKEKPSAPPEETPSGTQPAIPAIPAQPATSTEGSTTPAVPATPAQPAQPQQPPPTADIQANYSDGPVMIQYNTSAIISWVSANATSCSVTPGEWAGLSGSQSSGNLTTSTTYTVNCTNFQGFATDSVQVNVSSPPAPAQYTPPPKDTTPPVISDISATNILSTEATIIWTTNEQADSQVEYGLTSSYNNTTSLDPSYITSHNVLLSGLTANTTYHYRARSQDTAGNLATSADYAFTTASLPASSTTTGGCPNIPSHAVIRGSDCSWCYDGDYQTDMGGATIFSGKASCEDNTGVYTDYCSSGNNKIEYYCSITGDGKGNIVNVKCTSTEIFCNYHGLVCSDGVCVSPQTGRLPTPLPTFSQADSSFIASVLNSLANVLEAIQKLLR